MRRSPLHELSDVVHLDACGGVSLLEERDGLQDAAVSCTAMDQTCYMVIILRNAELRPQ